MPLAEPLATLAEPALPLLPSIRALPSSALLVGPPAPAAPEPRSMLLLFALSASVSVGSRLLSSSSMVKAMNLPLRLSSCHCNTHTHTHAHTHTWLLHIVWLLPIVSGCSYFNRRYHMWRGLLIMISLGVLVTYWRACVCVCVCTGFGSPQLGQGVPPVLCPRSALQHVSLALGAPRLRTHTHTHKKKHAFKQKHTHAR